MKKPALPFSWNRDRIWGLLLLAATFIAYQPAWNGSPVWDDDVHMTPPELRSITGLAHIWTHPRETVQYFPLVHTVFWVESHLWGDSTSGYHLLNILLHFFSALLLVRILRKLGIPGAWLAGGIFALHPVMVESVAWISELKNTLSGVFFLSAALAYLTCTETGKRRWYISALGLFILGLLSQTTIAPVPRAMLAVVWWKRGGLSWRRDIVPLLPFFLAGILFGLITLYVERTHIGTRGPEYEFSLIERCLIAGRALWFYLGKIFLPVNLMISYPRWVLSAAVWWQYLFPAAALFVVCILWASWRAPAAVFFYFTAMLLPQLGFFSFFASRYSFVADHYQYLAAIGPMVIGAGLVDRAVGLARGNGRVLKPLVTVILLLALGMLSWNQSRMYSDAETLYKTTIRKNPDSWMAHNNLGILLMKHGRKDEAIAHYRTALASNPNVADIHNNLGFLLAQTGHTDEAIVQYKKALDINPKDGGVHYNLGNALMQTGQQAEAIAHYWKAVQLDSNCAPAHMKLGAILLQTGRTYEAITQFQMGLKRDPNNAGARNDLGMLLAQIGRTDEAFIQYQKSLEITPNSAEVHNNIGNLLAQIGQTEEAISHYRKALGINPNYGNAYYNLGNALLQIEQTDEAIACYRKTLEIVPTYVSALENLAITLVQKGQGTDATSLLQNALASAKSAGDEARAKTIAQFMTQLHDTINSSQANSKKHAE